MVKILLQERNVFLRTFRKKVFGLGSADINQPLAGGPGHGAFVRCRRSRADLCRI